MEEIHDRSPNATGGYSASFPDLSSADRMWRKRHQPKRISDIVPHACGAAHYDAFALGIAAPANGLTTGWGGSVRSLAPEAVLAAENRPR
jgi:hypothetical protein